jgi:hypothetical protein
MDRMKGISFQEGVEFKLSIQGETWLQGEALSGDLEANVKNAGASLGEMRVILAETTERKLKSKSVDGFHVLEEAKSTTSPLQFNFKLPVDARISDKPGSLFILYGSRSDPHTLGMLKLAIAPHHLIHDLIELMRTEFRFALKNLTAGKGNFVEAKLEPSGSKEWAQLEELILAAKLTDETLETKFIFNRNAVDAIKAGLQTKIEHREIERSWELSEFVHDFNGRLNKDAATTAIQNVISEYRSAGWLA